MKKSIASNSSLFKRHLRVLAAEDKTEKYRWSHSALESSFLYISITEGVILHSKNILLIWISDKKPVDAKCKISPVFLSVWWQWWMISFLWLKETAPKDLNLGMKIKLILISLLFYAGFIGSKLHYYFIRG